MPVLSVNIYEDEEFIHVDIKSTLDIFNIIQNFINNVEAGFDCHNIACNCICPSLCDCRYYWFDLQLI